MIAKALLIARKLGIEVRASDVALRLSFSSSIEANERRLFTEVHGCALKELARNAANALLSGYEALTDGFVTDGVGIRIKASTVVDLCRTLCPEVCKRLGLKLALSPPALVANIDSSCFADILWRMDLGELKTTLAAISDDFHFASAGGLGTSEVQMLALCAMAGEIAAREGLTEIPQRFIRPALFDYAEAVAHSAFVKLGGA
jgi:hypothetical protein